MLRDFATRKIEYRGFLALWKDADPDIPILKEAKAEFAKPRSADNNVSINELWVYLGFTYKGASLH
jgi:hypothetical protein